MTIYMKDSGGTWRAANNSLADGVAVKDNTGTIRNVNSVWVKDNISWKKVYQKSPFDTTSTDKKRDMMFIGDSITWGYNLPQTQTYAYKVQTAINNKSGGYVSSGWLARCITTDDITSTPFNGGASVKIVASSGLESSASGNCNFGPFAWSPAYDLSTPTYKYPGVRINTVGGYIAFNITSPFPDYIVVRANGTGTFVVYQEGKADPIAPAVTLSSTPANYVFGTIPNQFVNGSGPDMSIYLASGSAMNIFVLHPTNVYNNWPNGFINVIVAARNSYSIKDYRLATSDLKNCIINTTYAGSAQQPIYVIAAGTVDMYDVNRAIDSPSTYNTYLTYLVADLTSGTNAGKVVLTIPPKPDPSVTFRALGGTREDYNTAIVTSASNFGCDYVDLYNGPFVDNAGNTYNDLTISNGCYQADGIHPTELGSQLLANRYISALGIA